MNKVLKFSVLVVVLVTMLVGVFSPTAAAPEPMAAVCEVVNRFMVGGPWGMVYTFVHCHDQGKYDPESCSLDETNVNKENTTFVYSCSQNGGNKSPKIGSENRSTFRSFTTLKRFYAHKQGEFLGEKDNEQVHAVNILKKRIDVYQLDGTSLVFDHSIRGGVELFEDGSYITDYGSGCLPDWLCED